MDDISCFFNNSLIPIYRLEACRGLLNLYPTLLNLANLLGVIKSIDIVSDGRHNICRCCNLSV
uniref:Uncharacterized protein n=1 Tax=Arundo donax TaxID=35708 RepID=A0A0A9GUZ4_ARUDO